MTTLTQFELKTNFIIFGNSAVSFASPHHLLHKFPIAVDIDNRSPGINPNNKNFNFDPLLYIILFIGL